MHSYKGFTLIEVLVAIAILAILAGLGAPFLRDSIETRRLSAATTDLRAVTQAWIASAKKQPQGRTYLTLDLNNQCAGYTWVNSATPTTCDCTATATAPTACTANGVRISGFSTANYPGVTMAHADGANTGTILLGYDHVRGLIEDDSSHPIIFNSTANRGISLTINTHTATSLLTAAGNTRTCGNNMPGYTPC